MYLIIACHLPVAASNQDPQVEVWLPDHGSRRAAGVKLCRGGHSLVTTTFRLIYIWFILYIYICILSNNFFSIFWSEVFMLVGRALQKNWSSAEMALLVVCNISGSKSSFCWDHQPMVHWWLRWGGSVAKIRRVFLGGKGGRNDETCHSQCELHGVFVFHGEIYIYI